MRTGEKEKMSLRELQHLLYVQSLSDDKRLIEISNVSLYGTLKDHTIIEGFYFKHVDFQDIEGSKYLTFQRCHFSYCNASNFHKENCHVVDTVEKNAYRCPPPSLASPVSRRDSLLTSSFDDSGFALCAFNSEGSPQLPRNSFFAGSFGCSKTHTNSVLTGANIPEVAAAQPNVALNNSTTMNFDCTFRR